MDFQNWEQLAASGNIRVVETDASRLDGWSYHLRATGSVISGVWDADFHKAEDWASTHDFIHFKELWVAREALVRSPDYFRNWRIVFRIDNSCAVHYVQCRYGRILALQQLAEKFELLERKLGCWCLAVHIKGKDNIISDAGSRDASFSQKWNNDPHQHCTLKQSVWNNICSLTGPFNIDLFADREGHNARAPQLFFPERSVFEQRSLKGTIWVFPPRSIAGHALQFANERLKEDPSTRFVLLLPEDAGASWYRPHAFRKWKRIGRWPAGSSLFIEWNPRSYR